jgi:hypothetical protein
LPAVIQSIEPYVSSEDIEKGARWGSEISKELEESDFGILCITPSNTGAPWLNFEAGALSKSIDRSRVVPFLFKLDRADLPQGPLVQFQSVLAEKEEVGKMVAALNSACGEHALDENRLDTFFDHWWPKLDEALGAIDVKEGVQAEPRRSDEALLAEVLEIVRSQQQLLNTPEAILPPEYVDEVVRRARRGPRDEINPLALRDLNRSWKDLLAVAQGDSVPEEVAQAVAELSDPLHYVLSRLGRRAPRYRPSPRRDVVIEPVEEDESGGDSVVGE